MKKRTKTKPHPDPVPQYENMKQIDPSSLKYFDQFPLSKPTLNALKTNGFTKPTEIQRLTLKHALLGDDIVVEAATGSGKTLGFLIPMLERLFTARITTFDGPVAVILTPTRELARQIYLVLKRFCSSFKFTILNIMGGKNSESKRLEWNTVSGANILIGTPGRFSQHMTENPLLDMSNLRILILDEADRLLDNTFRGDMDAIMTNLTPERQTLLFSATQNSTISQLARLHMRNPVVLTTKQLSTGLIPSNLVQTYAIVPLDRKLDTLWTFLQSHCKKKIIVFFSTQKQVRYTYELFHRLRPYFRVMELRGNMLQLKRFKAYDRFASTPKGCVLMATNVAERGLDFPAVDWVVQFDCPRALDDYIHRVGRTARIGNAGRAITFLLPSEVGLLDLLRERDVQLKEQKFPDAQVGTPVTSRAPALLAAKPELAAAARYAFSAYLSDYCLGAGAPDKRKTNIARVFDPSALPLTAFAVSLGLPALPELPKRFSPWLSKASIQSDGALSNDPSTVAPWTTEKAMTKDSPAASDEDDFLRRKPQYVSAIGGPFEEGTGQKLLDLVEDSSEASQSELEVQQNIPLESPESIAKPSTKKKTRIQRAKSELRRNIRTHSKVVFDETGMPIIKTIGGIPVSPDAHLAPQETNASNADTRLDVEREKQYLREVVDKKDRELWKLHRKEQNRLKRKKIKEARLKLQQARSGVPLQLPGDEHDKEVLLQSDNDDCSDGDSPPVKRQNTSM